MTDALIWTLGVLLSVILTIMLKESINYLLATIIGGIERRGTSIRGVWQAISDYETGGKSSTQIALFQIKQIGNYIVAKSLSSDIS